MLTSYQLLVINIVKIWKSRTLVGNIDYFYTGIRVMGSSDVGIRLRLVCWRG